MKEEQAIELAKKYLSDEKSKTVCVTSDGGVYVNNDVDSMRKHAENNRLSIFVLKDDETKKEKEDRNKAVAEKEKKEESFKEENKKKEEAGVSKAKAKLKSDKKKK